MPTKPKNTKSSSKTSNKATKAPAAKKSTKKSPSKKVAVVETVAAIENAPVFAEALTAPTGSQEVTVQADVAQTATSVNTDTLGGTITEVQTELPFVEATPTPTPALEVACGNECTCSTTEAAPKKKDHTKTILIVAGVIVAIACVLSGIFG
jgi:hypothetical protein